MPSVPRARPLPPATGADTLGGRLGRLFGLGEPTGDADPAGERTAVLRAENDLLRAVAAAADVPRLLRTIHGIAAAPGRPATSALLEAAGDGGGWTVRATAGATLSPAMPADLPAPGRLPDRPAPLDPAAAWPGGTWATPLTGGGRAGLWLAPPPPTGADLGRGRRLWELVGDALWRRFVEAGELGAARGSLALREAQLALHEAAASAHEPHAVLAALLDTLAVRCGADRAVLHAVGESPCRIAAAGAREPVGAVAALVAAQDARLAAAVAARAGATGGVIGFDGSALRGVGVEALVGRSAGALVGGGPRRAALLLTKADAAPLPPHARPVLAWAAGFLADVLPRCTRTAAAKRQARRDSLTGLANRRAFDERLAEMSEAALEGGGDLTLLMCDLDRFKSINDRHGHGVGDDVLRAVADAVRGALTDCRSGDSAVAARYGGEELAVLLPDFGPAGGLRVAEQIRRAVAGLRFPLGDGGAAGEVGVTISVGAATLPFDAEDPASLLRAADAALYAAKHGGRDRVVRAGRDSAAPVCA